MRDGDGAQRHGRIELGAAPFTVGALCVSGSLPQGDQDLLLWEIAPTDALSSWTVTATGVPDTVTTFAVFEVTSEPGVVPVQASGGKTYELNVLPDALGPRVETDVHFPVGRYLVGVGRSDPADGSQPEDTAWSLSLEPGPLPPAVEREPNDSKEDASAVTGAFDIGGDLGGSIDYYTWTVPEETAGLAWEFHGRGVLGTLLSVNLEGPGGTTLLNESSDLQGRFDLYDLRLDPGTYRFYLTGAGEEPYPYRLTTTAAALTGDPEPNDLPELAIPVDFAVPLVRGRLATDGDHDLYRITMPAGAPQLYRDIRLLVALRCPDRPVPADRGRCHPPVSVRPGGPVTPEPPVPAGRVPRDHHRRVEPRRGLRPPDEETAEPSPDFEAEPNDIVDLATPVDAALGMTGQGAPDDDDFFRLHVDGEAQLWDLEVTGDAIDQLTWHRADRSQIAVGAVDPDHRRAVLRDLFLVPGDYRFQVAASAGEYRIEATPLGPPDPDAEREPNDRSLEANAYRIGRVAPGRLTNDAEVDVFRFDARRDGAPADRGRTTGGRLGRAGALRERVADRNRSAPGVGQPTVYEVELTPGDYEVELRSEIPSEAAYRFSVERLDPFAAPVDQEPNDREWQGRPLPASGWIQGAGAIPATPTGTCCHHARTAPRWWSTCPATTSVSSCRTARTASASSAATTSAPGPAIHCPPGCRSTLASGNPRRRVIRARGRVHRAAGRRP